MVELLAPAASFDSLRGAVNAGCDAVYIGGDKFSARAYADNPDTELMKRCLDFCHLRGKKLYLTVNTLLKEKELTEELIPFLEPIYREGLDAVIVQDPGVMEYICRYFPGLPIHISTQASVTGSKGAERLRQLYPSVTRIVPARELSLAELTAFRHETDLEMEIFVHGALCYSYSGQCLMSSVIGGRSGNRGRCAQPCRKIYDGQCLLSLKDNCLLDQLNSLLDIGIDSLKIEGRMKSPYYTAGVVEAYRAYIDRYYACGGNIESLKDTPDFIDFNLNRLREIYNRGGFNHGYLEEHNGQDMMSLDRSGHTGVQVGEVSGVNGREAIIRLTRPVNDHDVLEIRNPLSGERVYEFTSGSASSAGEIISCLTMKGSKAARGQAVFRTRNNSLISLLEDKYLNKDLTVNVNMECSALCGKPLYLKAEAMISGQAFKYCVEGQPVQKALKTATDSSQIRKQLLKTGDTAFTADKCDITTDGSSFIPVSELNELRRNVLAGLEAVIIDSYKRSSEKIETATELKSSELKSEVRYNAVNDINGTDSESDHQGELSLSTSASPKIRVSVWNAEILQDLFKIVHPDRLYFNLTGYNTEDADRAAAICRQYDTELYLGLPYVLRSYEYNDFRDLISKYGSDVGYLARNQEELAILEEAGINRIITDYGLYIYNTAAAGAYVGYEHTLPRELNSEELKTFAGQGSELIIYGYQPVMFSAQCIYKNKNGKCCGSAKCLTPFNDDMGHTFMSRQLCRAGGRECMNIIYNCACLDIREKFVTADLNPEAVRYDLTFEKPEDLPYIFDGSSDILKDRGFVLTGEHFGRGII